MRSVHFTNGVRIPNMHGKLTQAAACGCCVWLNLKQKESKREARREMREAFSIPAVKEYTQ